MRGRPPDGRTDTDAGRIAPSAERPQARLLRAAARVFYAEGIRGIGVDRILAEANVPRATFYRYFPSKEDLVRAYIEERDRAVRATAEAAAASAADPGQALAALVAGLDDELCAPAFRGCAFINAAAEYPDPDHPVRRAIAAHRTWFRDTLVALLARTGHPDPDATADVLVLLRDGAMAGGYLDDPDRVRAALRAAVGRVTG